MGEQMSSASVHKLCSDAYNRESQIKQAAAEYSRKSVEGKNIIESAIHFDFKTLCFFADVFVMNQNKVFEWFKKLILGIKFCWLLKNEMRLTFLTKICADFLVPEELLKLISCSCETSCEGNRCGCRKHRLRCTDLCTKCRGSDNCLNVEKISEDFDKSENNFAETEQPGLCLITENQLYEESSDYPNDIEGENEIINRSDIEEKDDQITNVLKKPRIM